MISVPRSLALPCTGALSLLAGCSATNDTVAASVRADLPVVEAAQASAESGKVALASAPAQQGATTLLDTLLGNGAITPEQHRALIEATPNSEILEESDDGPAVTMGTGGFRVKSVDGESSIKIGGRVQVDANLHTNDGALDDFINDGTELRRARIELKGTLPDDLIWAAETEFADNNATVRDFWVGYDGDGPSFIFGNQKQPYSLDVEMSSNDIPFTERGVDTFLVIPFVDRAIGARVQDNGEEWFYAAGVYGDAVTPTAVDDEGWGATGRFVLAPVQSDTEVIHLGLRGSYRAPEDPIRIRDESTNMSNLRIVDTGLLSDVNGVTLAGAEATWVSGPFSIGGEWNIVNLNLPGRDSDFMGYHVAATYTLTGESRAPAYRMEAGEFKRLRANNEGERPIELAARYASLDLNSRSIQGGEEDVFSLGLNWYYSANLRLMLNWNHVLDADEGALSLGDADGLNIFGFRAQLNF